MHKRAFGAGLRRAKQSNPGQLLKSLASPFSLSVELGLMYEPDCFMTLELRHPCPLRDTRPKRIGCHFSGIPIERGKSKTWTARYADTMSRYGHGK